MLTRDELRNLEKDSRLKAPILSLYLNVDRKTSEGQHYLAELRRILTIANKQLCARGEDAEKHQKQLHELIVPRILNFIDEEVSAYGAIRAIAVFASLDPTRSHHNKDIIIYTLPQPVKSQTHVENSAFIRPLLFLLDQYERYAVIVANSNTAHFFIVGMGEIEESTEFISDIPQRTDKGGWAQKRYERRFDNAVERYVERVCKHATKHIEKTDVKRVVLGGDSDILYLFKKKLPDHLQKMVVGSIAAKTNESTHEILERTLSVAAEAERADEKRAVNELKNALAHQGKAVAGVEDTIRAVNEKRVEKMILIKGFHLTGSLCNNCNTLSLPIRNCPNCQAFTKPVEDIFENASELVFLEDGTIEFVDDHPDLIAMGNVGAILRF